MHVARPRDIELLTGLQFFPAMTLKKRVYLQTYLPEALWERKSWMDLSADGSCPDVRKAECPTRQYVLYCSIRMWGWGLGIMKSSLWGAVMQRLELTLRDNGDQIMIINNKVYCTRAYSKNKF